MTWIFCIHFSNMFIEAHLLYNASKAFLQSVNFTIGSVLTALNHDFPI